jgi:anti-sigma regulatory factor (Ser/Thr protein kinase)
MNCSLETELPRDLTAGSRARRLLAKRFAGELGQPELDQAKLLLSELVNNAVLHGSGRIALTADLDADRLRVAVHDDGTGVLEPRENGFSGLGGRGLQIVDAASSRWGVYEGRLTCGSSLIDRNRDPGQR